MQSHPLGRTCFSQYQASSAVVHQWVTVQEIAVFISCSPQQGEREMKTAISCTECSQVTCTCVVTFPDQIPWSLFWEWD